MPINNPLMKKRRAHFSFAIWAMQQPSPPTIAQIVALTGVSSNTAGAWRTDWLAARAPVPYVEDQHGNAHR